MAVHLAFLTTLYAPLRKLFCLSTMDILIQTMGTQVVSGSMSSESGVHSAPYKLHSLYSLLIFCANNSSKRARKRCVSECFCGWWAAGRALISHTRVRKLTSGSGGGVSVSTDHLAGSSSLNETIWSQIQHHQRNMVIESLGISQAIHSYYLGPVWEDNSPVVLLDTTAMAQQNA